MTLYKGNSKIRDTGNYGLYVGNRAINAVYYGSQKVYQYKPYADNTLLIYGSDKVYNATLPIGVYKVALCGAGNKGTIWVQSSYGFASSGGTGAFAEVIFYNPIAQNITLYSSSIAGSESYMELSGIRVITAGGGTSGGVNSSGNGGICTINSSNFDIIETITQLNGNNGKVGFSGYVLNPSISTYEDWGYGQENTWGSGGIRLEYLRYYR